MKKLLVALLAVGLLFGNVGLARAAGSDKIHIIDSITLNTTTTSVTGIIDTSNYRQVAFFVDYDETDTGGDISVAVTVHISHDATNFISYSWFDMASLTTLVASETLSADANYVGWFEPDRNIPMVRMTITETGADANSTAVVDAYILGIR